MMEDLRAKSSAAEALIEELMEENEDLKKEMRQMVDEMEELQDNFRSLNYLNTNFRKTGQIKKKWYIFIQKPKYSKN